MHEGASEHDSSVTTSGASIPESVQVPNREKMHIPAEEKMYRNPRHNPRFMYVHVYHMSDMHFRLRG